MESWYSIELGDGVAACAPRQSIQQAYEALASQGDCQPDLAVFTYFDLDRHLVTAYFSPSATALGHRFAARPCRKPFPRSGFVLLAGDSRSWEIHFPGFRASLRNQDGPHKDSQPPAWYREARLGGKLLSHA